MKHASAQTLQLLADLLEQIRQRQGLKENKLGIFYRKSKSFLHIHEDPAGTFADLAAGGAFDRYCVRRKNAKNCSRRSIGSSPNSWCVLEILCVGYRTVCGSVRSIARSSDRTFVFIPPEIPFSRVRDTLGLRRAYKLYSSEVS